MNGLCKFLDWDSEHFNKRIAQVTSSFLDQDDFKKVDHWCITNNIDCVYYLKDLSNSTESDIEESNNFRLVDTRVELKLKIDRVSLVDKNNILSCTIKLSDNNEIYSFVGDAIILSLKTFSSIYIDEKFLLDINYDNNNLDKFYFKNDNMESLEKITENRGESINSKVVILESALDECINKENYEAAAFIRDRIKQIKKQ